MYEGLTSRSKTFRLNKVPSASEKQSLNEAIETLPGTSISEQSGPNVTVEFFAEVVSESLLEKAIRDSGIELEPQVKKGTLTRALDRMARKNRETFGDGPLDCCKLNQAE